MSKKKRQRYTRKPKPAPPTLVLSDTWYTTAEVASIFRVDVRTIYYWLEGKLLQFTNPGGNKILINKAYVDALLNGDRRFNKGQ